MAKKKKKRARNFQQSPVKEYACILTKYPKTCQNMRETGMRKCRKITPVQNEPGLCFISRKLLGN